jgi:hypothetical protein
MKHFAFDYMFSPCSGGRLAVTTANASKANMLLSRSAHCPRCRTHLYIRQEQLCWQPSSHRQRRLWLPGGSRSLHGHDEGTSIHTSHRIHLGRLGQHCGQLS